MACAKTLLLGFALLQVVSWLVGIVLVFFPRVRTPCGHGAQVIIEGREIQSDGGEEDKDNPTNNKVQNQPQPKGQASTIL